MKHTTHHSSIVSFQIERTAVNKSFKLCSSYLLIDVAEVYMDLSLAMIGKLAPNAGFKRIPDSNVMMGHHQMPLVASGGPPHGCPANSGWSTSYIVFGVHQLQISPSDCHLRDFFATYSHW